MSQLLAKKLRITTEEPLVVLNRPDKSYFSDFHFTEQFPIEPANKIILFVETLAEMQQKIEEILTKKVLAMEGRLLICYPKKGNKKFVTFIARDDIFPALHVNQDGFITGTDYKFNQMVKLDDIYTIVAIKRTTKKSKAESQSVSEYVAFIPQLTTKLANYPQAATFFQSLTPGYQRNWARYVYSAKREATQDKRFLEMVALLEKGIKSKELA